MNKDKRNNIKLLGTLNNADESGIIANANQIYDANEDKSTQDVSKEHTERIKTLETKENSMQTTLENITKTGEASAASNVTYNHSDSKLDATNVQQAVDEVRKRSNYNDGNEVIDFNTIHIITDNPEFAIAVVDINNKILYGIKADGQPYWGVGVPKVVRDYVDKQVNDILGTDNITETIDSLKEVEKFLSDFKNSDTLKALLDTKANKTDVDNTIAAVNADIIDKYKKSNPNDEEGNVIDTNSIKSVINNPEYFKAFVDNTNKLIEAIGLDGVRKFFAGIEVQGTLQCVTDNPEYLVAWVDKENKIIFAIQHDGNPYFGYGVPKQIKNSIDKQVNLILTKTVFDISAYHATGGTLATYDDLEDALGTNGKNIPQSLRKGGMSVKFVQSSDNKYVQYRLMSDTFNATVANWQGVDDNPTAGSNNLVDSDGVYKAIEEGTKYNNTQIAARTLDNYKLVADDEQNILWERNTGTSIVIFNIGENTEFHINGSSENTDCCQIMLCCGIATMNIKPWKSLKKGSGQYDFYGKTNHTQQFVAITVGQNSSYSVTTVKSVKQTLTEEISRSLIADTNLEFDINKLEFDINKKAIALFEPLSHERSISDYKLIANESGLVTDNAGTNVEIFYVGANKGFFIEATCSIIDCYQIAICSGTDAKSFSPWTGLKQPNKSGKYQFYGETTQNQQYVAITVDNNTSYSAYFAELAGQGLVKEITRAKTREQELEKGTKMIVSDIIYSRKLENCKIGKSLTDDLLGSSNTTDVYVFHVGANKNFSVIGTCSIQNPRIALTKGTTASDFATFEKIPVNASYDYYGKTTNEMQYVAITVDKNTVYHCYLWDAIFNYTKDNIRQVINILRTDTDIQILTKMLSAIKKGNCDVYFEKAIYTLQDVYIYMRDTLGWSWTMELPIGNGCRYFLNGATLISNAPEENFEDSRNILGCKAGGNTFMNNTNFELHDGILINNGGTYCVHDEAGMSLSTVDNVHKYYNMKMVLNTGERTETLSKCIGGGAAYNGFIIIENCVFENNNTLNTSAEDVSWHGLIAENSEPADMKYFISNNFFSRRFRVNLHFHSYDSLFVKYTGNSHLAAPDISTTPSVVEKILFNNELRTT